jgi:hypothetical protein
MRRMSEMLLLLPLLPIFFLGMFPMLLFAFLGFAGLVILGILMICVGLGDGLAAKSEFNQEIIVRGYAPRSERTIHASNLHSAIRLATVVSVTGTGIVIAGLIGILFRG